MLNIEYEFKRGFFFTRLSGNINKTNYSNFIKDLDRIIKDIGLRNIVINLNRILGIESSCLKELLKFISKENKKGLLIYLCDNKTFIKNDKIIPKIYSEKEVYNLI